MRNDYKRTGNKYLVIRYKPGENAPFKICSEEGIEIIDGDNLKTKDIEQKSAAFNPDLVYVSGWTDKRYRYLAKKYRDLNLPVILGMDNHWKGSIKQHVASFISTVYLKKYYSHIWIPGTPQYYFARKLGFSDDEIITGLYCADENNFKENSPSKFERQITFVGRLVEHKGINILCNVLEKLIKNDRLFFSVQFIGNGPLKSSIPVHRKITHTSFVPPDKLPAILNNTGFLILPSLYEAWGVVVHEAALSGLPLISTYQTGATTNFLIHGYNGFLYHANDQKKLYEILLSLNEFTEKKYFKFSQNSKNIASRINLDSWSATLNSLNK